MNETTRPYQPAQQPWVCGLTIMQQSVLFAAIRNGDGLPKHHAAKMLLRWYRRCVLYSAFDLSILSDPNAPGGGSFTGTLANVDGVHVSLERAQDFFLDARDEMTLHYYAHSAHAFEILGYKHPDPEIRSGWKAVYERMAHALHMWPETEAQMDLRLGDNPETWAARNDPSSVCSD